LGTPSNSTGWANRPFLFSLVAGLVKPVFDQAPRSVDWLGEKRPKNGYIRPGGRGRSFQQRHAQPGHARSDIMLHEDLIELVIFSTSIEPPPSAVKANPAAPVISNVL